MPNWLHLTPIAGPAPTVPVAPATVPAEQTPFANSDKSPRRTYIESKFPSSLPSSPRTAVSPQFESSPHPITIALRNRHRARRPEPATTATVPAA